MNLRYVPIDQETLECYLDIMIQGNIVLKSYHDRLKDQFELRANLKGAIFSKVDQGVAVRFGKVVVRKVDLQKILAVRAIELRMLEAFAGTIYSQAKLWYVESRSDSIEDVRQEITAVMLDAIYYYTDPRIKFITYAIGAIRNRMITKTNTGGLIALPDSANNRALLQRYDRAMREMKRRTTFSEVCEYMGLNEAEISLLRDLLVTVSDESEVQKSAFDNNADGRFGNDYTAMSLPTPVAPTSKQSGYYRHNNGDVNDSMELCDDNMLAALRVLISHADEMLDEWERAVLFAALDGEYGWQAKVASIHKNKITGRPYTRQNVRWVMKRIGERIESIARGDVVSKVA